MIEPDSKKDFTRYISAHTILHPERAANLYEFCIEVGITKEEVVENFGNPENLTSLFIAKEVYYRGLIPT